MQSKYIPPLSAKAVAALPLGTHNVGGVPGLYLRKLQNKAFFYLRYSDGGKRRDFYLGSYPKLSLAQARVKASTAKSLNEQGISPGSVRIFVSGVFSGRSPNVAAFRLFRVSMPDFIVVAEA